MAGSSKATEGDGNKPMPRNKIHQRRPHTKKVKLKSNSKHAVLCNVRQPSQTLRIIAVSGHRDPEDPEAPDDDIPQVLDFTKGPAVLSGGRRNHVLPKPWKLRRGYKWSPAVQSPHLKEFLAKVHDGILKAASDIGATIHPEDLAWIKKYHGSYEYFLHPKSKGGRWVRHSKYAQGMSLSALRDKYI